jgi:hypothetical protein
LGSTVIHTFKGLTSLNPRVNSRGQQWVSKEKWTKSPKVRRFWKNVFPSISEKGFHLRSMGCQLGCLNVGHSLVASIYQLSRIDL